MQAKLITLTLKVAREVWKPRLFSTVGTNKLCAKRKEPRSKHLMNFKDNRTKLIINKLPSTFTEQDLYNMFVSAGGIKHWAIIRNKETGANLGYGFVRMATPDDAQRAIHKLDNLEFQNTRLSVRLSQPKLTSNRDFGIYVNCIPTHFREEDLRPLFSSFGKIEEVRLYKNFIATRGSAIIVFDSKESANEAKKAMNGIVPKGGGNRLIVRVLHDRPTFKTWFYNQSYFKSHTSLENPAYGTLKESKDGPKRRKHLRRYIGLVRVENIYSSRSHELYDLFSLYGLVLMIQLGWDYPRNRTDGYGTITLSNMTEAKLAIEKLNGYMFNGLRMKVFLIKRNRKVQCNT